tara:strand:- start:23271 stop:23576 length:306 start_codon:yes stop_codon:yes gene_type:complete
MALSKKLKQGIQTLEDLVPLPHTVRVTRPKKMEEYGTCEYLEEPDRFLIRIHARLADSEALGILAHEWAHALAWTDDPLVDAHGPEWGVAYSRCYQALWEP